MELEGYIVKIVSRVMSALCSDDLVRLISYDDFEIPRDVWLVEFSIGTGNTACEKEGNTIGIRICFSPRQLPTGSAFQNGRIKNVRGTSCVLRTVHSDKSAIADEQFRTTCKTNENNFIPCRRTRRVITNECVDAWKNTIPHRSRSVLLHESK